MMPHRRRRRYDRNEPDMTHWTEGQKQEFHYQRLLDNALTEVGLPVRVVNALENHGVFTVRDLTQRTVDDLLEIANLGLKTIKQVYTTLKQTGVKLNWRFGKRPQKKPKKP